MKNKLKIYLLFGLIGMLPILLNSQENNSISCADGIDNDGDGLIDCQDSDCQSLPNNGCVTCLEDGLSFADIVIDFQPVCDNNSKINAQTTLGVSDFIDVPSDNYVSLGPSGSITLGFTNNLITNSGNNNSDIWIFEVGPVVEACKIELKPFDPNTLNILINEGVLDTDNDGYFDFGTIQGAASSVDIDNFVFGYGSGVLKFDAIKIIDLEGMCGGITPGADIDAVCALSTVEVDCAGTINGLANIDDCGQCLELIDPNYNNCLDCQGTPFGTAVIDTCGMCLQLTDPNYNNCLDCAGTVNGSAIIDDCGQCLELIDPNYNNCLDCQGTPFGTAVIDTCGICLELNDPNYNNCLDCAGTVNGSAIIDDCGQCLELIDPNYNNCLDCQGTPFGTAVIDTCGICLELNDPNYNNCLDCAGTVNGSAIIDDCGQCLELIDPNYNNCLDCQGTPFGTAVIDTCGMCLELTDNNFNQSCASEIKVFIPNVFSPNSDGKNDRFNITKESGREASIKLYQIYSRWGELIYQANNFNFSSSDYWWDGRFDGRSVVIGIYVYYIEVELKNGDIITFSGDVTVLK